MEKSSFKISNKGNFQRWGFYCPLMRDKLEFPVTNYNVQTNWNKRKGNTSEAALCKMGEIELEGIVIIGGKPMDRTVQMANELENMIEAGEIDGDVVDDITSVVKDLREGKRTLNEFYRASTPQKLLDIFDEVNQRVKR